jgi:YegS/Rv2252/BmrU family lipid kinase
MSKRVLVIYNPAAGQRGERFVNQVVARMEDAGAQVSRRETSCPGELEEMVRRAPVTDWDCIAVAGGDGSLMEAVNGTSAASPPLALIPTGTANVVSLELGLPSNARQLADVILKGQTLDISLAEANGRRFVFTAGVGFDAYLVATVSSALKRRIGKLAFAVAGFHALRSYGFPILDIKVDGNNYRGAGVIVMNGSLYAGRYVAAPDRKLADPDFSVLVLRKPGISAAFGYVAALGLGRLSSHASVEFIPSAKRVEVTGRAGLSYQADGDNAGVLPLTVRADAGRVKLMVPEVAVQSGECQPARLSA